MANILNDAPINEPIVANAPLKSSVAWTHWFDNLVNMVSRPQVTATLDFPNTAAQNSADIAVAFPENSVALGDLPIVSPPPGSVIMNTCYTAHIVNPDEVVVRFNNYSAIARNPASGDFIVTVIKQ